MVKFDESRDTYDRIKHYSRVLMQQGRVQVDADWNEQSDIIAHRAETEALDVIGPSGGPLHDAAFHIVGDINQLTKEEAANPANQIVPPRFAAPNFLISAGRYYVDGILCENERLTAYTLQPDLPRGTVLSSAGQYVVYLDVWQRHLTALDDSSIRETALGGPDTATRAKTVWQVKWISTGEEEAAGNCLTPFAAYDAATAAPDGKLAAREALEADSTSPCIVPPGAGYSGLENQLYRVEVHEGGTALKVGGVAPAAVTRVSNASNQVQFKDGMWEPGQSIEIVSLKSGADLLDGTLAQITAVDGRSRTLTLNRNVSSIGFDTLGIRSVDATYKWSRDNGVVVTAIENIDGQEVTVHDLGPDAVLGFAEGQWVEILDDERELKGLPGQLAQIVKIDRAVNLVTLSAAPAPLVTRDGVPDTSGHPKMRRWDGIGAIKYSPDGPLGDYVELEDGVQVRFEPGTFRTGDYWTIPARTATAESQAGNIEWPQDGAGNALAQLPFGIEHHYCRLAMLTWNGKAFDRIEDCRKLFPPVTELTSLVFLSGSGQESLPGEPLAKRLHVGVFNGRWPVVGAHVRFTADGLGRVADDIGPALTASTTNELHVLTGSEGIASCAWRLEADVTKPSQRLTARLLDAAGVPVAGISFNANLSIASQVFYDPGDCKTLVEQTTVQKALDRLSRLVSLYEVSGNGQHGIPGGTLDQLVVLAANRCGPVAGQKVSFRVTAGNGTLSPAQDVTKADGTARVSWTLDKVTPRQEVEASLVDPGVAPTTIRFVAYFILDPAVHVNDITDGIGKSLSNDTVVDVNRLISGINVVCDEALIDLSAGSAPLPVQFNLATPQKPTCFVTIDLPYPLGVEQEFWQSNLIIGFQPLILASTVEVADKQLLWRPTPVVTRWLQLCFDRLANVTNRLLVHLTVKGNFVWSKTGSRALDGNAFGIPSSTGTSPTVRTSIAFPSGDFRRGGDFEMWFWLSGTGITIEAAQVGVVIRGIVRDVATGSPLPSIPVTATLQAKVPVPLTTQTNTDGNFEFAKLAGAGRYEVRAAREKQVATKILDVIFTDSPL